MDSIQCISCWYKETHPRISQHTIAHGAPPDGPSAFVYPRPSDIQGLAKNLELAGEGGGGGGVWSGRGHLLLTGQKLLRHLVPRTTEPNPRPPWQQSARREGCLRGARGGSGR